jgi:hypothetical protein
MGGLKMEFTASGIGWNIRTCSLNARTNILAVGLGVMLLSALPTRASFVPPATVNPTTNRSLSGEFVWEVDPSDMYGAGSARYRVLRNGSVLWQGEEPFTLRDCVVADSGLVAGYAYTRGVEGDKGGFGEFVVSMISPAGELRLKESVAREASHYPDDSPNALAEGTILDQANGRFIVRVRDPDINRGTESWWVYELISGKAIGKFPLVAGDGGTASPIRAVPVAGTPLILVHYWRYEKPNLNARFALLDPALKEVWSLTWPRDYNVDVNRNAEDLLRERIWAQGAILNASAGSQFELLSAKKSERVTFRVQPAAQATNGWVVAEVSRARYKPPQSAAPPNPIFPKRPLKLLGTFLLRDDVPVTRASIRDVVWFGFDDRERIGLLRFSGGGNYSFALIDPDGKLIHEQLLLKQTGPLLAADLKCAWVSGDRWIVVASGIGSEERTAAWWMDGVTGKLEPIKGFSCPTVRSLVGSGDGGFVALVVNHMSLTTEEEVIAFDSTGARRWRIGENSQDKKAAFRPGDIALTGRGQIAILDKIQANVHMFGPDGRHVSALDLEKAWGRKPNYPDEISAEPRGGLLICDLHGSPSIVRMDSAGKVVSQFDLKHSDGRVMDPTRGVKVSPSGRVWAGDDDSLARFTDEGIADLVLGPAAVSASLSQVAAVAVDQRGHLCAVDARTGAAHVFDQNGKQVRVCSPNPSDFSEMGVGTHVTIAESGEVFLTGGNTLPAPAKYVQFGADGRRVGVKEFGLDHVTEQWYSLPAAGGFLVLGYQDAFIVSGEGKATRKIQRRADNNWLDYPQEASVAADGSFAIVSGRSGGKGGFFVNLYSAEGNPIRTILMPTNCVPSCFAFTGNYLATCTESELCLFNAVGEPVLSFPYPLEHLKEHWWLSFATQNGRELWMVCPALKKVVRFEMPE